MQQLKFSVDDETHSLLEEFARMDKVSLSEAVRQHVERSLDLTADQKTDVLLHTINKLAVLTLAQTGKQWFDHPGACGVFMQAVALAIQRANGGPMGLDLKMAHYKPAFKPKDVPTSRPVPFEDQDMWGVGIESVEFFGRK
jgi:hypothetical protein